METVGAPQPWPSSSLSSSTPANLNDCSPGICTIYCFQKCNHYLIPPRPFGTFTDADASDSGSGISPLMVALISVLASAFLLLTYYTVISKYCKRRRSRSRDPEEFHIAGEDLEARLDQLIREPTNSQQASSAGLDERLIKSITVFKYRRGDGLIEGTDCAVCLNEFKEEESLRLMPNCQHAFHIPCIDTWLKSQSNCPLCRSAMIDQHHPLPVVREGSGTPASVNVSAMRVENRSDVVVVVTDMGIVEHRLEIANSNDGGVDDFGNNEQRNEMRKEEIQR